METDIDTDRTRGAHVLRGLADLQAESCRMAGDARQRILIYDWHLCGPVYEQNCFVESVKQLAIRHVNTHVQILLADTEQIRLGGHRLLNLARRLPSAIEIYLRAEQFAQDMRGFMLVDDSGHIYYPVWHDLNDVVIEDRNRFRVRQLAAEFAHAWELSAPDPRLRQLSI